MINENIENLRDNYFANVAWVKISQISVVYFIKPSNQFPNSKSWFKVLGQDSGNRKKLSLRRGISNQALRVPHIGLWGFSQASVNYNSTKFRPNM